MSASETFPTEVLATVGPRGTVDVLGRAYWAQKLSIYSGRTVRVMVPKDEYDAIQVWLGTHFLASADRMLDAGFADVASARAVAQRRAELKRGPLKDQQASIVGRKIVALVQIIDERIECQRVVAPVLRASLLTRMLQRLKHLLLRTRPASDERVEDRELQVIGDLVIEGALSEAGIESALALFDIPDTMFERFKGQLGFGHGDGLLRECQEAKSAPEDGHRLSEVAK
ncbi:hypothetical protein AAG607_13795 [Citromicrobium bathyomarinum]|uniref:hypothetical protein n=1 Tax=Citromicrobium bathyomarinum TaxID=72174 RepID=UPI003159FE12